MVKDARRPGFELFGDPAPDKQNWGQLRPAKHQDFLLPNIPPWQGYFDIAMPQDNFLPEPKPWKGEIPGFGIPLSPSPTWPPTGLGLSEDIIILGIGLIKQLEMQGREENLLLPKFPSFYHS